MGDYWNQAARQQAIGIAAKHGLRVVRNNMKCLGIAQAVHDIPIYIATVGAVDSTGKPRSIVVVIHPNRFKQELCDQVPGVEVAINRQSPLARFGSSNYIGLPIVPGTNVPGGPAFTCAGFTALDGLLAEYATGIGTKPS